MHLEAAGPRFAERFSWESAVTELGSMYRALS
jgi:hypothetical protein